MRIKSIPERSYLTLENLTAWETKNYQWKKYSSKQNYVFIHLFVWSSPCQSAGIEGFEKNNVKRDLM